jgi:prefoldin subunit 5
MASGTITLQNVLDTLASEIDAIASSITALNNKVAFVDNLTSTNASLALSANQGRVLKGLIDSITSDITNINQAINNITTGGGSGGSGSSINVIDNLTSTSALDALSAKQGKILKDALEAFISTTTTNLNNITTSINNISSSMPGITDNLTSTSTTDALSAKQGKVLKDLIDSIGSGSTTNINVIDNLTSDSATDALSAKQGKELDNKIPQIVNALDSSETTKALSAKQGKVLKDNLDNLSTSVTSLQTNLSNLSQSVGSMNTSINNMQTAISSLQNAIPLTLNETVNKTTEELNTYLATLENKKGIVDITLTTAGDDTLNISVPTFDGVLRIRGITTTKSTIGTLTINLGFTGRLEIYSLNYTLNTAGYRNGAATYLRSQDTSIKVPSTGCSIYGGILVEMTGTGTMEAVSGTPTLNLGWGTKFDTNASQTISNINITCRRLASCNILATLVNTTITKQTTAGANISDIPNGGGGPEILYKENATDAFAQSVLTGNQDKIYFYKEQYE